MTRFHPTVHPVVAAFLLRNPAILALLLLLLLPAPVAQARPVQAPAGPHAAAAVRVLVFTRTTGFRHASIPDGIALVQALGPGNGFEADATENPAVFTDAGLAPYAAVVFLNTTGDVLNAAQQAAFERYIRAGGGFVGVHAAADTEYDWPWYGGLVGAYFQSHPPGTARATIRVADRAHPSTAPLPDRWVRTDEWYNFRTSPRPGVHVLATLNERTYAGGTLGHDHPIAWCQPYAGGRAWYTAGGHTREAYAEPLFQSHLLGGILYAAGMEAADCGATLEDGFEHVVLDDSPSNPMELAVAPDGRVLYVERGGAVKLYRPETSTTAMIGRLAVETAFEDGLLGIALDPGFAVNGWLYLFYSPAGPVARQRVSRFTLAGDVLDPASERILLEIPTQRTECCHSGGSLAFGPGGNLFISTGDNTNPFVSDGFAPIDERPGRSPFDAQKSSSNTNDLRGKILRIHPEPDGTYTIPEGNLFPTANGIEGRPEIYAMGLRNPFRISIDAETGWLYWGDVGPDASAANPARGPLGYDEWNQAREAGNFGWPYCIGDNRPYMDYDFATGVSRGAFSCAAPRNDSPNNTGSTLLPPAREAWIWYPYGPSAEFPELGSGGRTAMAGPVYHYDPNLASDVKLPAYYDRTLFIYEWSRNWIKEVKLDANGDVLLIQPFLPGLTFTRPMDLELGPDGALYLLEWGTGFGGDNPDARLVRIGYRRGNHPPTARAAAEPSAGPVPLTVRFSSEGSFDSNAGDFLSFAWSFRGDGVIDATEPNPTFTYTEPGDYTAQLTVTDSEGLTAVANVRITAGNSRPVLTLEEPVHGGFFGWGDFIPFRFTADDAEDGSTGNGTISCTQVVFLPSIGHDEHAHPLEPFAGCEGLAQTPPGHGSAGENVFFVVEASYTDQGAGPAGPLTGRTLHLLQPKRKEAEHFSKNQGTQVEPTGDRAGGGRNIGYVEDGDYVSYAPMNLRNIGFLTYRVASAGPGGRIEVRVDAPNGRLISTALVEPTGEWQVYRDVTTTIEDPGGTHELFFVFLRNPGGGTSGLFNVNWIDFHGSGVAAFDPAAPNGLQATYFASHDLTGDTLRRTDPVINFNWGMGAPHPTLENRAFSARWTGYVTPAVSEPYTFYARTEDGVRLWIDDTLVIDRWADQVVREWAAAPIPLTAGRRYAVRMEFYRAPGSNQTAQAHLFWSSASTPKSIVPRFHLHAGDPVSTGPERPLPAEVVLEPAYPNPFHSGTRIRYGLPGAMRVRLEVYDVLGRHVASLIDGEQPAGLHDVRFEAGSLASGVYVYRLATPGGTRTGRMVLLR